MGTKRVRLYFGLLILVIIFCISLQISAQDIIINELMSSNQKIYQDQDSDFDDWLELKNVGNEPVNISGYYLSDNSADLTQWQFDSTQDFIIKPNNHILIWADDTTAEGNLHTNFKLSSSGETIILTQNNGRDIVDQLNFPRIMTDVSYGRKTNNISKLVYFIFPTPGEENNFGISNNYLTEKIKLINDNLFLSSIFFFSFIIISIFLISYYKINKKLENSKIKFEELFKESPVGLISCDIRGNILNVNKEMINLLGAPDKEAVQKFNITNIADIKEEWNRIILSFKNNISGQFEYTTPWEKHVFIKYKIAVISSNDNILVIILAANDVSVEKITENRLEYLSFHDELTALYNRRYFENELEKFNQSRKLPISIIIGDLDNLKYINDNFGHKTGDKYLVKAAKIMKDNFRNEDIIARIGGDEFAAILPDTNTETAAKISERIRSECRKCEKYK